MPIQRYENIYSINCFVYHNVQFDGKMKVVFDTASYFTFSNGVAMSSLDIDGDLEFKQTWPLPAMGGYHVPYESDPLIPTSLDNAASTMPITDVTLQSIMKKYSARNCKQLLFICINILWINF